MQKSEFRAACRASTVHSYWSIGHAHSPVSLAPNRCLHSLCVCQRSTSSFLSPTHTSPKQPPPPPRPVHNDSASSPHAPKDYQTNLTTMPPKGTPSKGAISAEEDVKFLLTIIKQLDGTVSAPIPPGSVRKRHCTREFHSLQHLNESSMVLWRRRKRKRVLWLPRVHSLTLT